jgi:hypothetical protein
MKNFFMTLLGDGSDISSKRFSGIITLLNLIGLSYVATVKQGICPEHMFDTLALLCGGFLGLTTIEAIFAKKKNPEPKKDGE